MLGQGTASNPYLISNEEDLNKIRENTQASYRLTNDIYMTSYQLGEGWLPIEEFYGAIDGGNYTIHDLYINRPNESVGFIKRLEYRLQVGGGKISNLHFKNVNIVGGENTGVIAGTAKGYTDVLIDNYGNNRSVSIPVEITGCTVEGIIRSASNNLGGLIGTTLAEIRPTAWNDNQLVNVSIENSHADLNIHAFGSNIGGLVGDATSGSVTILTSSSRGKILNGYDNIGGLVGTLVAGRGRISNSYSLMDIQGANYVGGMIGEIASGHVQSYSLTNSYFAGTLDAPNRVTTHIGAVAGYWRGVVNGDSDIRMIYDESKAQLNSPKHNLSNVKDRRTVPLSTSDIQDVRTFVDRDFDIIDTWYASQDSKGDYLRLKNEFNEDLFTMLGDGTKENPYQIDSIHKLISITSYDRRNWIEYNNMLDDENSFSSPNYKPDMNFSSPNRYHYKLTNDINLDVYPWNEIGWYPLTKVKETTTITTLPLENITATLWDRAWIEANNSFRVYNSIGQVIAYTDGVSTLETTLSNHGGLGGQGKNKHIKGFMGILNGNDFSINGLSLKEWRGLKRFGLFDVISGGTVENLKLKNVNINVDYHRGRYSDERPIGGVVSSTIQATSNVNKVSVGGLSTIKDYRADVGGARFDISGFIHQGRRLDKTVGSELRRASIKNTSVSIENTFTNVDTSDTYMTHFTPFMNLVQYVRIEDSYSASSYRALSPQGQELSGVHGDRVFARNITGTGIILRSYYDSEIVNSTTGSNEDPIQGKVEINGRSTEAMKLQSTYTGWDFDRVWDISGFDYPEFKPYDENYVPPVYKTEYLVKTQVDALYMRVIRDFVKKNVETITLRSVARKFTSKTRMEKSGSTGVTTQIDDLFSVAFAYENPVIEEREVTTGIEELESELDYDFKIDRQHIVLTSIDELHSSTTTSTISKGAFYNGISIEAIRNNSIVIKVNDSRVEAIEYNKVIYSTGGNPFVTIRIEASDFEDGESLVEVKAKDIDGVDLLVKTLKIEKTPINSQLGNRVLVNGKYYDVVEENGNVLTLDRELEESAFRVNAENTYNMIESGGLRVNPTINGLEPTHTGSKFDKGMIRDEYELTTEISESTTKLFMSIPADDVKTIAYPYISFSYPYGTTESGTAQNTVEEDGEYYTVSRNNGTNSRRIVTYSMSINVLSWFEENVSELEGESIADKIESLKSKDYDFNVKWRGKSYKKDRTDTIITYGRDIVLKVVNPINSTSVEIGRHNSIGDETITGLINSDFIDSSGKIKMDILGTDIDKAGSNNSAFPSGHIDTDIVEVNVSPKSVKKSSYVTEIGQTYIPKEKNRGEF